MNTRSQLHCMICKTPLSNGLDTFGDIGQEICQNCWIHLPEIVDGFAFRGEITTKFVYVALRHGYDNSDFLGIYTTSKDAVSRCERKAGQPMQWFDNKSWQHAADNDGYGYVVLRTYLNGDYEIESQS